jgi:CubicO group peptidase (beta-lactamase class C family)
LITDTFAVDEPAPLTPEAASARAALPFPLGDSVVDIGAVERAQAHVDMEAVEKIVSAHFADDRLHARGFLLIRDGHIIYERYRDGFGPSTKLHGWSASKSLLAALIAARVKEGKLRLDTQAGEHIAAWADRPELAKMTVGQMLRMSDGLDLDEIYYPGNDVTDMLFLGSGLDGVIANASLRVNNPTHPPCFHYSSMTTNILCKILKQTFATEQEYQAYPTTAVFGPLGMQSGTLESDVNGVFQGSSFMWATVLVSYSCRRQHCCAPLLPTHPRAHGSLCWCAY